MIETQDAKAKVGKKRDTFGATVEFNFIERHTGKRVEQNVLLAAGQISLILAAKPRPPIQRERYPNERDFSTFSIHNRLPWLAKEYYRLFLHGRYDLRHRISHAKVFVLICLAKPILCEIPTPHPPVFPDPRRRSFPQANFCPNLC